MNYSLPKTYSVPGHGPFRVVYWSGWCKCYQEQGQCVCRLTDPTACQNRCSPLCLSNQKCQLSNDKFADIPSSFQRIKREKKTRTILRVANAMAYVSLNRNIFSPATKFHEMIPSSFLDINALASYQLYGSSK